MGLQSVTYRVDTPCRWTENSFPYLKPVEISKIYYLRIPKLLSNKILLTYFNLSEPIHKIQFNVRYPVERSAKTASLSA